MSTVIPSTLLRSGVINLSTDQSRRDSIYARFECEEQNCNSVQNAPTRSRQWELTTGSVPERAPVVLLLPTGPQSMYQPSSQSASAFPHSSTVPPADDPDNIYTSQPWNQRNVASQPPGQQLIYSWATATTEALSAQFPLNEDMGGGDTLGVGWVQAYIAEGQRSSSANIYLAAAINRPNIHADTVITTRHRDSEKRDWFSAGSIGTPQGLLLQGIAARDELQALGTPIFAENSSVAKILSDHVLVPNVFYKKDGESLDALFRDPSSLKAALDEWMETKRGVLASNISNHGIFQFSSTPRHSPLLIPPRDPKHHIGNLQSLISTLTPSLATQLLEIGSYLGPLSALISPTSRGSVTLVSANSFTHLSIDPNYLTSPLDIFAMRETVRAVKRFAAAEAWTNYIIAPIGDSSSDADADLDAYVRDEVTMVYHTVGTASVSPRGAEWGIVDPDLKVKGAEGIRILDASVLPFPANAYTQGLVYLVAERAAELFAPESMDDLQRLCQLEYD